MYCMEAWQYDCTKSLHLYRNDTEYRIMNIGNLVSKGLLVTFWNPILLFCVQVVFKFSLNESKMMKMFMVLITYLPQHNKCTLIHCAKSTE